MCHGITYNNAITVAENQLGNFGWNWLRCNDTALYYETNSLSEMQNGLYNYELNLQSKKGNKPKITLKWEHEQLVMTVYISVYFFLHDITKLEIKIEKDDLYTLFVCFTHSVYVLLLLITMTS